MTQVNEIGATRFRAVDLFCGSGAVTTGLSNGFDILAAVDNDSFACETYAANHPEVRLFKRDIRSLDPGEILNEVPAAKDLDLLVVCAPCQPFSNQNRKKGSDPRADLVLQSVRFAAVLKPSAILFENVPGLAGSVGVHAELTKALNAIGYVVGRARKLNAADMGVPQRRLRCVMFAAKTRSAVERFEATALKADKVTVAAAIGEMKPLASGERDPDDPLHVARAHSEITLERLRATPHDGGSRSSWPAELRLKCHEGRKGFPDVYGRMAWCDVAPTLTTGCTDMTRGRFAHPEQDRSITLREAALLQTFPLGYIFHGTHNRIQTQIGNAVPVIMVKALVPALSNALLSA